MAELQDRGAGDADLVEKAVQAACGWAAAVSSPVVAPIKRHESSSRAWSSPGKTTAPCGRRLTAAISRAVALLVPVDPATMTGPPTVPVVSRLTSASISRI